MPWPNVSYQPDQKWANMRTEEQPFTTRAGTIVGAVRFDGHDFTAGHMIANGYDYYSGGIAEVHPLAPINVIAGHKE